MSDIKDFGFGEEEQMLRNSARKLFEEYLPTEKLHKLVASQPENITQPQCMWDKTLWKKMVDLGWTMALLPERVGGLGMSFAAAVGLAEEVGRAACPSPLLATLTAGCVLDACDTREADEALMRIAKGSSATLALANNRGSWEMLESQITEENGLLNGSAWYVQDAQKADFILVKARSESGINLFLVECESEGLRVVADNIADLTRDQAHIELNNVSAQCLLCEDGKGASVLEVAEPAILTLLAADMCGAAEWQLQTTADYARIREQFGRPIGFFQAVKHPLVDLMSMIDCARSHTYNAAAAIDFDPSNAEQYARMAKSAASDAAAYGCSRSVQFHGGIGFTWECFVHIYFKRQKHSQMLMGDGIYHRCKLADLLIGPAAA